MKNSGIIFLFLLVSCSNGSNLEHVLTNDSQESFWIEKRKKTIDSLVYTNHQWEFYPDGSAECLLSFNPRVKGHPIIFNIHKQPSYAWKYEAKDNILDIGLGVKYKIVRYNSDTVFMATSSGSSVILIRNH